VSQPTAEIYELYGWRVRSEIRLPAETAKHDSFQVDVRWGRPLEIPPDVQPGRLLAHATFPGGHGYAAVATDDGFSVRFFSAYDFRISRDLRSIDVHRDPHADEDLASILLAGAVLSILLVISGGFVLHASAVEAGGSALALFGGSKAGKSTLAAFLCSRGARLLTDDALRLDLSNGNVRCFRGTGELRLRQPPDEMGVDLAARSAQATSDGRIALRLDGDRPEAAPLGSIIVPKPSAASARSSLRRLGAREAFLELVQHPHILGWQCPDLIRRQFEDLTRIARIIPVFLAELPWAPPFPDALAEDLMATTHAASG
jgi:hypothetical protein